MKAIVSKLKVQQPEKKIVKKAEAVATPADVLDLETSLVDAIDSKLEASNGTFWKQSESFAPSNTNPCPRFAIYRMKGYQQTTEILGQTRRIFDMGNRIEDAVGQMFTDLGILTDSQVPIEITDPVPIKGYIDFIIDWNGPKIVECKSINEAGFAFRSAYHKPKDEHFRQIQFYLHALDFEEGFLFYYSKNNSAILPLLVKRDDKFIETTFAKYKKIYDAFKEGKLPVRPYKKTSQNCSRCDAFDHCWTDKDDGVVVNFKK
jgi:hypothetical protein